jgi:hypothetical protein
MNDVKIRKLMLVIDLLDSADAIMQEAKISSDVTYDLHTRLQDLREDVVDALVMIEMGGE